MTPADERIGAVFDADAAGAMPAEDGYGAITTEVVPAGGFYFTKDYHQQYLSDAKNPDGYCGLGGPAWRTRRDSPRLLTDPETTILTGPDGRSGVLVEPLLDGVASQFNPVVQLQLAERVLDVVLHGPVGYDESFRDLLVRQAFGD